MNLIPPPLRSILKDDPFVWNQWFMAIYNKVTQSGTVLQQTSDPVVADIAVNEWQIIKNTTTGVVKLWVNDNGTLKSTTLT